MPYHKTTQGKPTTHALKIGRYATVSTTTTGSLHVIAKRADIPSGFSCVMKVNLIFKKKRGNFCRIALVELAVSKIEFPIRIISQSKQEATFIICSKKPIEHPQEFLKGRMHHIKTCTRRIEQRAHQRTRKQSKNARELLEAITR